MIKRSLLIFTACLSFAAMSQKELTLEDAVMNQYRAYYPSNIAGFSWVPNTTEFTYLEGYINLVRGNSAGPNAAKDTLSIGKVNGVLGSQLRWFSGMEWKNEKEFYLSDGSNYYLYNPKSNSGSKLTSLPEEAANATLESTQGNVAYTIDNNLYISSGGKQIQVTDFEDENIVSGQAIARSEFGITNGIFWSPKGNYLAFYQKDETDVTQYPLVDYDAYPAAVNLIKYPMAGQKSEKPKVGIYNLKTKKVKYICPKGDVNDYLTNLSWSNDESFVLISEVNRDQNKHDLNKFDNTGKYINTLFHEESATWTEPEHAPFFPEGKNNNFILIHEGSGYNNMYYHEANGKLIKQLTSNDFIVKEIVAATDKEVFFTATGDSPLNTMLYKVDYEGNQTLVTKTEGVHRVSISEDGNFVFDQYSNSSTPNKANLLNGNGDELAEMLSAKNPYEGLTKGTCEVSTIKSADGKTDLYTRLIKPSNFDASKKYPVLVYVYGGPHAQMITNSWGDGASLWMYWMAEQGYLVYTVDNRGSGERGKKFESVIHRNLGVVEMADQMKGVEYLKSLPYVDGDRLAVHGWSFGGFMTSSLMLRNAGTFNVGVAGGPVTDWKYYEIMYGERYMDRPEENVEGYKQASLLTHAEKLEGDLLLIHGTSDNVVVMQHNLALVRKFVELGIQMDFFPYPMHEHNVRGKDRVHLMQNVLDYVLENNK